MFKTVCLLSLAAILSCSVLVGCGNKGADGADAPLTKSAGPATNQPKKATVPNGAKATP